MRGVLLTWLRSIGPPASFLVLLAAAVPAYASPVQAENQRPGDSYWRAAFDRRAPESVIEGYASSASVAPGQSISFYVRSSERYRVEIDRLGWYGGRGGRRLACLASSCAASRPAVNQPPPPAPDPHTGEVDAGWSATDGLTIPTDWVSGYYLAEFVVTSGQDAGYASFYPFIVLPPSSQSAAILLEVPVNTWQAYNNWGGKSLYSFNSTNSKPATQVSFDRPFAADDAAVLDYEVGWVHFLERYGYDVAYTTNVDVARTPGELLGHLLDISVGHDEYWSQSMRNGFEAARGAGVNLAFLGADTANWQVRYARSNRVLIEYRSAQTDPNPDPAQKTVQFKDLTPPRPQCQLLGVQYQNNENAAPSSVQNSPDYQVTAPADPWMAGTGFRAGDSVKHVVGYEWDQIIAGCAVPPLAGLFSFRGTVSGHQTEADAVRYIAPSGATIFSTGTLGFVYAVDPAGAHADPRAQRFMLNALNALTSPRTASPPGKPAPRARVACTAKASARLAGREGHRRRLRSRSRGGARLIVRVTCTQPARITVAGKVAEAGKRATKRGKPRVTLFRLRTQSAQVKANVVRTVALRVPQRCVAGLRHHRHESASVTVTATNAFGTSSTTASAPRLSLRGKRVRKHASRH